MLHAYVPSGKKKLDWKEHIKTKRDYDCAVASGIGWVVFDGLPLSWERAEKILNEENNNGK